MLTWKDYHQETPLHVALKKGFHEIANYLISEGAEQNLRTKQGSILSYLWKSPCTGSRERLLRNMLGHDISPEGEECLNDFLASDAMKLDPDRIKVFKILVDLHRAEINGQIHLPLIVQWNPEDFAYVIRKYPKFTARGAQCVFDCTSRCRPVWGFFEDWENANLKTLLSHLRSLGFSNRDIFGRDPISGQTPFCAQGLQKTTVQILIEEGGDINLRDRDGVHPVFYWSNFFALHQFETAGVWWKEVGVELTNMEVIKLQAMVPQYTFSRRSYNWDKEPSEKVKELLGRLFFK